MKSITLTTLATLIALSPVLAPAAIAGSRDSVKTTCNHNGRCVQVQKKPPRRALQKPRFPGSDHQTPRRTHPVERNKTTYVAPRANTRRALPGRDVPQAHLRHLPRAPKGQVYRVVDNRVLRVDQDTAVILASLGLLTALVSR